MAGTDPRDKPGDFGPATRARTAILISGRGSNMAALIAAARDPAYPAEVVLVVSNRPDAAGLALARDAGVAAVAIDHRPFRGDRAAHEAAIDAALRRAEVEIVCLAGYMRLADAVAGGCMERADAEHPSEPVAGISRVSTRTRARLPRA